MTTLPRHKEERQVVWCVCVCVCARPWTSLVGKLEQTVLEGSRLSVVILCKLHIA